MNRRSFVQHLGASLAAVAGMPVTSSSPTMNSRSSATDLNSSTGKKNQRGAALASRTMHEIQELLNTGAVTSEQLTREYLRRIEATNIKGVALRAVICMHPDALREAQTMDKERRRGNLRGPLHGVPILIKDNIDTRDMPTTAGSLLMASHQPGSDAPLVKNLREAGAIILGKTNLSEWANFRSTRSSSGWSSIGGQARNPHVLDRSPSGSSSGSAIAVAASLCAAAIGTETDGSIVSPASSCGIVGFKPTVGLIDQQGIIPISATQDTAGPMARSVRDCAVLMNILQQPVHTDPYSATSSPAASPSATSPVSRALPDHTAYLYAEALRGKRIGVDVSYKNHLPAVVELFEKNLKVLRACGAEIIECSLFSAVQKRTGSKEWDVLLYEFNRDLSAYLKSSGAPVHSLQELIDANIKNADRCMPAFGQEIFTEAVRATNSQEYTAALESTLAARGVIDDEFAAKKLDAVVCVTTGPAWCIDLINGDSPTSPSCSSPAAMSGFPHATVPMGFVRGLPVGLSVMSTANTDAQVLGYAYAFEQASTARRDPAFAATVSL
jgi:amidase